MKDRLILIFAVIALALAPLQAEAGKRKSHVVQKGESPGRIAKKYKITVEELLRYNNLLPGETFRAGTKLSIPRSGEVTGKTYTVKSGDSLAKIADFHGVGQLDLRAANRMRKKQHVRVGQKLIIPTELRSGASRGHVVREGDTLKSVAKKYKVSIKSLAAINKLKPKSKLRLGRMLIVPDGDEDAGAAYVPQRKVSKLIKTGRKVPGGVEHTVQSGQTLWSIARAYNTSGDKIVGASGLDKTVPLSVGQKILIPGAKAVVPVRVKGFSIQPIRFVSVWNDAKLTLRLMKKNGQINQRARKQLSRLVGPKRKTKRIKLLHARLIHLLQRVAERFPGRTIDIVSGFRAKSEGQGHMSKHNQGRAVDFRVRGIDNKTLYKYVKTLPNVGAGYYPNSVWVHMDVREQTATWTDMATVGGKSRYIKRNRKSPGKAKPQNNKNTQSPRAPEEDAAPKPEAATVQPPAGEVSKSSEVSG